MEAAFGLERSLLTRMAIRIFQETKASIRLNSLDTFGLSKAIAFFNYKCDCQAIGGSF
jgi:hypothetical protein